MKDKLEQGENVLSESYRSFMRAAAVVARREKVKK
jgi:hypothetical protein